MKRVLLLILLASPAPAALPAPTVRRGRRRRHPPAHHPSSWADHDRKRPGCRVSGRQQQPARPERCRYPDAAPARVLRRPRPPEGGRSCAGPRSTALIVRRAAETGQARYHREPNTYLEFRPMPLPPVPQPWPYSSESDWVAFRDALAHVTAPEVGFWRTHAARELARIGRCRSAPAEPLRHTVAPRPDEHPAGWPSRQA
jgi:hypothetical protein